ncbi:MAG: sulfatase-like hydrolase/transferase [Limisphaerales bacterium]
MRSLVTGVVLFCVVALSCQAADHASKPNIILILSDDVGLGNISCYGADKFKTPHIDAMAKAGTRFTYSYAAPLCGPSRCELLTGRYAFHTGMTGNDSGSSIKPKNEMMIAKILKPAGYVSASSGKWGQLPFQPSDFGFDEYFRFQGSGVYWKGDHAGQNKDKPNDRTFYTVNGVTKTLHSKEYMPALVHEFAINFIRKHKDEPFFLYYPMVHIHEPMRQTPDSTPESKDFFAENITYMDKLVGKLMDELDALKLREKTLVFFAADNGTAHKDSDRSTLNGRHINGHKGELLEGGSRVPLIVNWPGTTPPGVVNNDLTDFSDIVPTIAEIAGAKLPDGVTIDGHSFAAQIRGEKGQPRDWVFVELGNKWYVRDSHYKLTKGGDLFDLSDAPYEEKPFTSTTDNEPKAARQRLQAVLDKLNPAGGKQDDGDGSGRHAHKLKKQGKNAQTQ